MPLPLPRENIWAEGVNVVWSRNAYSRPREVSKYSKTILHIYLSNPPQTLTYCVCHSSQSKSRFFSQGPNNRHWSKATKLPIAHVYFSSVIVFFDNSMRVSYAGRSSQPPGSSRLRSIPYYYINMEKGTTAMCCMKDLSILVACGNGQIINGCCIGEARDWISHHDQSLELQQNKTILALMYENWAWHLCQYLSISIKPEWMTNVKKLSIKCVQKSLFYTAGKLGSCLGQNNEWIMQVVFWYPILFSHWQILCHF